MLFCGNLYRYVGVFNEANRTVLVVLASTRINISHGGRLELLTSIYIQFNLIITHLTIMRFSI